MRNLNEKILAINARTFYVYLACFYLMNLSWRFHKEAQGIKTIMH